MNLPSKIISVCFLSATSIGLAGAAGAAPISASLALRDAAGPAVQNVQWRGHWGGWGGRRGWGGFGGALMGGALAATASPGYGYDYDYGPSYYGYGPAYSTGYYSPGYAYDYGPAPGPYLQSCGYVGGPKTGAWTCFR